MSARTTVSIKDEPMTEQELDRLATNVGAMYRLKSILSAGDAARVHLAEEIATGRRVAIKVLRADHAAAFSAERFLTEVRVARRLDHPNIVPVIAFGMSDGLPYYVMPFVDGPSLSTRLRDLGRLPIAEVLQICDDIGAALDHAHRRGVVHRDLKPENLLLGSTGAMLVDFGIALALDVAARGRLTAPGILLGTPEYMSPEQIEGVGWVDGRSDVYSLACVTYEMLAGHPPFTGPSNIVLVRHLYADAMPLCCRLPGTPSGLAAVLAQALAKAPAHRFATAGAFAAAMRTEHAGVRDAVVPSTSGETGGGRSLSAPEQTRQTA